MDDHTTAPPVTGVLGLPQQYLQHHPYTTPTKINLNPNNPSFYPQGMELQRYRHLPPTPPSVGAALPADMLQLRDFMLETRFNNFKETSSLERKTKANSELIHDTRETVQNDLRFLHNQILELKEQLNAQKPEPAGIISHRRPLANQDVTPPKEFLDNFSKESIAEVYLEEAQDYEAAALRLKEQAAKLRGGEIADGRAVHFPEENQRVNPAGFACCGTDFVSLQEMLCHVEIVHGFETTKLQSENVGYETPTHIPLRHIHSQKKKHDSHIDETSEADTVMPVQTETAIVKVSIPGWIPLGIRQMPPSQPLSTSNNEIFTFSFLQNNFNGKEWSPGFYFVSSNSILPSKSYWIMDSEFEPFLPYAPGLHGAKLTAFFNSTMPEPGTNGPDEHSYLKVPVFIQPKNAPKGEYIYFGNYSQRRFSDKLDFDHLMSHIPDAVRRHHAAELADIARPDWVSSELRQHLWPKPVYEGPIPTNSAVNTPTTEASALSNVSTMPEKRVMKALVSYAEELKEWDKESKMRLSHITEDSLMEAFGRADEDMEPGLRLYFEYLQFEEYDGEFYEFLVELKKDPKLQGPFLERGRQMAKGKIPGKGGSGTGVVPPHLRAKGGGG